MTNVIFDGNDLQTATIITSDIQHESIPEKDAKTYALAHANRSVMPIVNYPRRVITLSGTLLATTVAGLDSLLDTFKAYLRDPNSNLDIDYNGSTRRYVNCTLSRLSIDRPRGLTHAKFNADFWCTEPFGQATTPTIANTESAQTGATDTWVHSYAGTAPYQLPVITLDINSITGGDGFLTVKNNANGQGITIIGQTFVAADQIVIDSKNRTVTKNGTEIDYLGAFPELPPGSQTIAYSDGFTTRNFDVEITYVPLYL